MTKKIDESHISDLQYDPRNARKRTIRSSALIQSSLQEVGASRSIVIDEHNRILAGNGTIEAAGQIGIEKMIIVDADGETIVAVRRSGLTEQQKIKLALFDNRASDLSEWDADVLAELSQEIDLTGLWSEDELSNLLASQESGEGSGEEDEQEVSDLIDEAESGAIESRVSLGQIWKLGRHYIACGDSTDEGNVRKLLGDRFSDVGMVWADPPYGIDIVGHAGNVGGDKKPIPFGGMKNLGKSKTIAANIYSPIVGDGSISTALNASKLSLTLFFESRQIWWGANHYSTPFEPSSCWIIWDKQTDGNDFADAELAWCSSKTAVRIFRHMWQGMVKASEHGQKRVHPTQKPIALCEWCFEKYGKPNDLIFDPFLGSAPSIIAAQKMEGDRAVFGFELSEAYCEVICRRFESLTGINAELVGNLTT